MPGAEPHSRPPLRTVPAPAPVSAPQVRFDGGHIGLTLGLAVGLFDGSSQGALAWDLRLGVRYATLLQLLDLAAWAELGAHPTAVGQSIGRQALGADVSLHPLFWILVWDNLAGWVAAGLHGYAAAGLARVSLKGEALVASVGGQGDRSIRWAAQPEVGLGVDVPLSGRGHTSGLWLTLRWGLRWLSVGDQASQRLDLGDHHVSLTLGWRSYGALSAPSPTQSAHASPSSAVQRNRM